MEAVGTICAGEWNSSFNGVCSGEADFMAQCFGNCSLPFWGGDETEVKDVGVEETNTASISTFSLGNSVNDSSLMAMDYLNHDASNDSVVSDEKLKRRRRVLGQSQRRKKLRKCVLADENENGSNNASMVLHRQSLRGCCSEDDSNEADGLKSSSSSERRETQNSNGRRRASRGSATDPQSLYARKRRERINEMRTLQSLVPNGTKVGISTMLEEAVQYVKFLQLQIKLLSSDDVGVCSYCLQWDGHRT